MLRRAQRRTRRESAVWAAKALLFYAVLLGWWMFLGLVRDVNWFVVGWTGMWFLGASFVWRNLRDERKDLKSLHGPDRTPRNLAGARWSIRKRSIRLKAFTVMTVTGFLALLQLGSSEFRAACIMAAGALFVMNEIRDRDDRATIEFLPDEPLPPERQPS